jgi:hypothetical protein
VIFTALAFSAGANSDAAGPYDTYLLFNNALGSLNRPNNDPSKTGLGLGGQMTEVRVYAAGALPLQTAPNT